MGGSTMLQPPLAAFCTNTDSQHFVPIPRGCPGLEHPPDPPRLVQTRIQGGWHPTPSKALPFLGVECTVRVVGPSVKAQLPPWVLPALCGERPAQSTGVGWGSWWE